MRGISIGSSSCSNEGMASDWNGFGWNGRDALGGVAGGVDGGCEESDGAMVESGMINSPLTRKSQIL